MACSVILSHCPDGLTVAVNYRYTKFIYYSKQFILQNIGHGDKTVVACGKAGSIFDA